MTASPTNIPGYEIIRELGVGGMANVYLAIQRSLDRKVAIKVMKRNIDDLEKFERRFLVEGRTMAKLPHRNIVAVYDIVKNDEVTYIAMEFLDGGTLSTKMKEGLSLADAISVVVQIAQALQFAHEHGIVHRDLKPANIMFRDVHTPVLTDFGIAKQQDATATRLTQTGMLVGTPTYMSPEQINAIEVDGRSDLYSLGILFYELLTGSPPFHADTPIAVLMAHLTTPPPPLPAGFVDFQPVLDKMLAKSRDDRFASLKDFTRALKSAVVNNQNLWARLQGDPSQSSSEQLRALGFSGGGDSMSGAGASGEIRLPPSGRGGGRTPTPGPVSLQTPGMSTGQQQMPTRRPVWIWAGAAVVVLGIGIAAFLLWPQGGPDTGQMKIADILLVSADQQIKAKDWAKAVETIGLASEAAPGYEKIAQYQKQVVDALKAEAEQAIGRNDLDTALAFTEQAKLIDPKDAQLNSLTLRIAQQRNQAAAEKEIGGYIARAEEASKAGRDLGVGGAYSILMEALAKAPQNARVKQQVDAVVARALKPARDALARNDLQGANAGLREAESTLANEPAWQQLRGEVEKATDSQAARVRLAGMLQAIDGQIAAGKLVQPAGDNAQESLARALALDGRNPEVLRRQDALANALTQSAQQALNAGKVEEALQGANEALNVKDGFAAALTVKQAAEGKLSADRAKVIEGLAAAKQAIAAQRFLSPANNNAAQLLANVLRLDPANVEAQDLRRELPQRIADAAKARAAAGDVEEALALVDEARKAYPTVMELASLGADLS
ncbi:MAG TPA: serine/threonine-protein kinase, partial [Xanthomonadales bacterium]|nr:serine/threonine-protein kinase [Xanthomonadales bacterium]